VRTAPTDTESSSSERRVRGRLGPAPSVRQLRGWNAAVAASSAIVLLLLLATGIGWLASMHSRTTTYSVPALVSQVDLQVSSGQAVIVGSSSPALQVRRTDDYSFGHSARERRWLAHGVLHIASRCPQIVVGSCSASYELAVPEAVAVRVQTDGGNVRMTGFNGDATVGTRSGNVDVEAYCGFRLSARSQSGDVYVATACAPQSLSLLTGSGDAVALVPPGRYRIGVSGGTGGEHVTGLRSDPTAPFSVDAHSVTGGVTVEGGL
jgi:hypothetical protein